MADLKLGVLIQIVKDQLTAWTKSMPPLLGRVKAEGKIAGDDIAKGLDKAAASADKATASTDKLGKSLQAANAKAGRSARGKAEALELAAAQEKLGKASAEAGKGVSGLTASFRGLIRPILAVIQTIARYAVVITAVISATFGLFSVTKKIAEILAKQSSAVKEAEKAGEKHREGLIFTAAAAKKAASEVKQYADVQTKTSDEILRLGAAERDSYTERLEKSREYHLQVLRAALAEAELGKDTKATQEAAGKALQKLRDGFLEVEKAAKFAADAAKQGLNVDAAQAIEQFKKLRAEGKATEAALKAVSGAFDLDTTAGLKSFSQTLGELSVQGLAGAKAIGQTWDEVLAKFSGRELTAFAATARASLGDSQREVQALADITDGVLRASLRGLGQDAEKALDGVSAAAADAISNIETVVESGKVSGAALTDAFNKAFEKLDTVAAVERMKAVLRSFGTEGKLSIAQVTEQVDKLNERAAELTPGIQSTTEAYKQLGIEAPAALKKAADAAREAFEFIRDSGGTVEEIRRAFLAYAKAALVAAEASGKPAAGLLRAQAAALGLKDEFGKLEKETQKLSVSFEAVARAQDQAIKSTEAHTTAVEAEGRAAIATAQAALEQAKARNNVTEITRAAIALAETESTVAAKVAQAKREEAAAAEEKVVALAREAAADQELTEAEREVLAVAEEVAAAKIQAADDAEAAAQAKAAETAATGRQLEAEQGIAIALEQSLQFQKARLALAEEFGETAAGVFDKISLAIENAARGESGFLDLTEGFVERLRTDAAEATREILRLTSELANAAAPTDALTRDAELALERFKDLGDEALSGLRQALADAKQRTEALRDAAADTLEQLRDQFDQLKGNEEAVQKREFERRKKELEGRLKEAEKAGDSQAVKDLRESLRLLEQIRVEKEKQAKAQEAEDKRRKREQAAQPPPPPPEQNRRDANTQGARGDPALRQERGDTVVNLIVDGENIARKIIPAIDKHNRLRA